MKRFFLAFLAFFGACAHRPDVTPPPHMRALQVDGGVVFLVTNAYLMELYPKVHAEDIKIHEDTSGLFDPKLDMCFVCVENPAASAAKGLTQEELFTAIHEHAHQDDFHAGQLGSSARWLYLRDHAPHHMRHADINKIIGKKK